MVAAIFSEWEASLAGESRALWGMVVPTQTFKPPLAARARDTGGMASSTRGTCARKRLDTAWGPWLGEAEPRSCSRPV